MGEQLPCKQQVVGFDSDRFHQKGIYGEGSVFAAIRDAGRLAGSPS